MIERATAVTVRALGPTDRSAWLPLWQGYQTFYQVDIAPAVTELTWARLLDPSEPLHGAVALLPGEPAPVGFTHWVMHRSTWSAEDGCYLEDLFVAPAVRGQGVASALIEHVAAAARLAGTAQIHWLTHETNAAARRLYDKLARRSGFIDYQKP